MYREQAQGEAVTTDKKSHLQEVEPPVAGQVRLERSKNQQLMVARAVFTTPDLEAVPGPPTIFERFLLARSARRRQMRLQQVMTASGLFDPDWYRKQYSDVVPLAVDAAHHFLIFGRDELRDPGPHFSTRHYLAMYPDVRESGMNPLMHFIQFGWSEERVIRPSILGTSRSS